MTVAHDDDGALAVALAARRRGPAALDRLTVGVGLLIFAIVWLNLLDFTSLSPPADDIEQLTWVRSMGGKR